MEETIHFMFTGGTIDSFYNGAKDSVETSKESSIPNFLGSLKLFEKLEFSTICMKDSRSLTMEDRGKLLQAIQDSPHKKIIVTHGTYTMPDTARFLEANLGNHDKTIILTASMIPLMGFAPSDAPFNLGFSVAKVLELDSCIRVCMNGKTFEPNEVVKIIEEGRFDSVFNNKQ